MYFWVNNGQIVGSADTPIEPDEWPSGWSLVEAPAGVTQDDCYWDGTTVQLKPPQPSPSHYWDIETNEWTELEGMTPPTNLPLWDELVADFQTPGNEFYLSVAQKVAASGFIAQDHWQNFKSLLITPNLRSVEMLGLSVLHLRELLLEAGHPLSASDLSDWNDLMMDYNFPEECWLED